MKARAIQEQIEIEIQITNLVDSHKGWTVLAARDPKIAELQKLYTANEELVKTIDLKIQSLCGGAV